MSIFVMWDNEEKSAIRMHFQGDWKWTDFDRAVDEIAVLSETVPHTVDVLLIKSHKKLLPEGTPVTHFLRMFSLRPCNMGRLVVVGDNLEDRFGMTLYAAVMRSNKNLTNLIQFVDTMPEAYQLLAGIAHNTAKTA